MGPMDLIDQLESQIQILVIAAHDMDQASSLAPNLNVKKSLVRLARHLRLRSRSLTRGRSPRTRLDGLESSGLRSRARLNVRSTIGSWKSGRSDMRTPTKTPCVRPPSRRLRRVRGTLTPALVSAFSQIKDLASSLSERLMAEAFRLEEKLVEEAFGSDAEPPKPPEAPQE